MNPFYLVPGSTRRRAFAQTMRLADRWGGGWYTVHDRYDGDYLALGADAVRKLPRNRYHIVARAVPHPTKPMFHRLKLGDPRS
jgi:hypothetical protein